MSQTDARLSGLLRAGSLYTDRILFVKTIVRDTSNLELLDELLGRFDEIPNTPDRILALAVGVAPSQITSWRSSVKERRSPRINNEPKSEILSVLGHREDERIEGMEWMIAQMRETVEDYETAARVRRELREGPAVKSPEDERKLAETAAKEMGGHRGDEGRHDAS